jgi:hypothetical protein
MHLQNVLLLMYLDLQDAVYAVQCIVVMCVEMDLMLFQFEGKVTQDV